MKAQPSAPAAQILPFNSIRVEAEFSKYPLHNLDKSGKAVEIQIVQHNEKGEVAMQWLVSHSSRYGQPGPLAYKIDTLVINRRLDEIGRPLPKWIGLGSLRQIAAEVGVGEKNTTAVKKALRQNAHTGITAKLVYRDTQRQEQKFEGDFHRYSIVFTGETLPDGRTADAVYLIFNDLYRKVLNSALTRPLDYDYLKELPPTAQRFYEIVSYQIFAALKHRLPQAKLRYSKWCLYAARKRYVERKKMRDQMRKIHRPHLESGYLAGVDYQESADEEGRVDWYMCYIPGPKALAEYQSFNHKQKKARKEPKGVERSEAEREFQRSLVWEIIEDTLTKLPDISS